MYENVLKVDPEVGQALVDEYQRQTDHLELIASENYVHPAVLAAAGSVLTNKYAEGYPGKRYYGGCQHVDVAEDLAIQRLKSLFGAEHANVQPHSGAQANMSVFLGFLKPGDRIMGMDLSHGGHLTHGHPLNYSGMNFEVIPYGVEKETENLDYDKIRDLAKASQPKMIIAGASAFPRVLDFEAFSSIAKEVGAYFMVDMAHIAGLVACGLHPSPVPYADFVTSTTHKTLRGPRGGIVLCKEEYAKDIDRAVFPGVQGGPLMHIISAKAVAFGLALKPEFKEYMKKVVANADAFSKALEEQGFRIVSGGTDNHLMLVDTFVRGNTGRMVEKRLGKVGITVNKNTIPFDTNKPMIASGIRVGTPAVTSRGMGLDDMKKIANWISQALSVKRTDPKLKEIKQEVTSFCQSFPLFKEEQ
ncbi:MAG: serine hydroxymethyltransferase [Acidobacteria bacterium]|nr:MAG: serine hydroxymethyltransferase [Acidobacteriota bacterium]